MKREDALFSYNYKMIYEHLERIFLRFYSNTQLKQSKDTVMSK
jgi:hypothetical protein